MFKSTIKKAEKFTSKEGKACHIIWFNDPNGMTCKLYVNPKDDFIAGDDIDVSFECDWNGFARVVVKAI